MASSGWPSAAKTSELAIWPTSTPSAAAAAAAVVTASGSIRTRLGAPLPSRASAESSASCTVLTLGCMAPRYGATRRSRSGVAVLSYPGFTLVVVRTAVRIDRAARFAARLPRLGHGGPVVAEQETGFSRVRSPGRGVRPPPPTPGRRADASQPGVAWGSSTFGWHRLTVPVDRYPSTRQETA